MGYKDLASGKLYVFSFLFEDIVCFLKCQSLFEKLSTLQNIKFPCTNLHPTIMQPYFLGGMVLLTMNLFV